MSLYNLKKSHFGGWFPLLTMILVRSQWGHYILPYFTHYDSEGHASMILIVWLNWKAKPSSTGGIGRPTLFHTITIEWTLKSIETQHMKKSAQ